MPELLAIVLFGGGFFVFALSIAVRIAFGSPRTRATAELGATPQRRALQLLNERYALGEITRDEYLERRAYLD